MEVIISTERAQAEAAISQTINHSRLVSRGLMGLALVAGLTGAATLPEQELGAVFFGTVGGMLPVSAYAAVGYRRRADKIVEDYRSSQHKMTGGMAGSPNYRTTIGTQWINFVGESVMFETPVYDKPSDTNTLGNDSKEMLTSISPYLTNFGALVATTSLSSEQLTLTSLVITGAVATALAREQFLRRQGKTYRAQLDNIDNVGVGVDSRRLTN